MVRGWYQYKNYSNDTLIGELIFVLIVKGSVPASSQIYKKDENYSLELHVLPIKYVQ